MLNFQNQEKIILPGKAYKFGQDLYSEIFSSILYNFIVLRMRRSFLDFISHYQHLASLIQEENKEIDVREEQESIDISEFIHHEFKDDNALKNLKCSICLSICNKPKRLPCKHSFCGKCIRKHATMNEYERGPLCPNCIAPHHNQFEDDVELELSMHFIPAECANRSKGCP